MRVFKILDSRLRGNDRGRAAMRHPAYPEYKESGVEWLGNVPKHWAVKRLKVAAYLNDRKVEADEENPVPYVGLENIESWTGKLLPIDPDIIPSGVANRFTTKNTLFGKLRPYLAKACNPGFDGLCSTELLVIESEDFDRRTLLYWLLADGFIKLVDSSTYGSKMPRANWDFIGNCLLPVPPLPEQTAIADFLDRETGRIDALVKRKRRLIELLREKRTALISRTVTRGLPAEAAREFGLEPHTRFKDSGVEWLGEVPEEWEIWKLSHGFQNTGSGTTPPSDNDAWYDGNIPWVTTSELRESIIYETSKNVSIDAITTFSALKLFPEGSLAIAMYGATIGRLGILGVPATTNQACCVMYGERDLNARFMFLWFQAFREQVILLATGGGQPNISQEKIRSIRVACPSIPEQTAIATYLDRETSKIDRLVEKVEAAVGRLQEYRTALITAAVTGKIDVREAVA